jgi:pyruvate dehydrogenase E2 component (dihydrolipoamide acetyltransferase)
MPVEIVMPRLSDTMERGTVARWLKKEGEEVKKGEPLAEIETDKATLPLESFYNGRVGRIMLPEGGSAPIGEPIATILRPGEEGGGASASSASAPSSAPTPTAAPAAPVAPRPPAPSATEATTPAARAEPPASATTTTPSVGAAGQPPIPASPLARRVAEELGVDLATVKGTGPNGRITREDVEGAARAGSAPAAAPTAPAVSPPTRTIPPATESPAAVTPPPGPVERPLTRMQETIARRMSQSKTTVPHFYVTIEADVTALMALREQLNASWTETRVGVEDMVVKALGIALTEFPIVNASWQNDRLVYHQQVNVGVALAVENGLLVPVLHDVQAMSLRTLSQEIKELRRRARDNQAQTRDFQGGTFTVSNLGPYGVDEFLAIVNPPESGILALGAVERKPVARGDQVVISQRMRLSLSADHRVYYGATAAQFLGRVRELLEKPLALLA